MHRVDWKGNIILRTKKLTFTKSHIIQNIPAIYHVNKNQKLKVILKIKITLVCFLILNSLISLYHIANDYYIHMTIGFNDSDILKYFYLQLPFINEGNNIDPKITTNQ